MDQDKLAKKIGYVIYAERMDKKLTLEKAAERTGVSINALWRAENGKGNQMNVIARIAYGYGISLEQLTRKAGV